MLISLRCLVERRTPRSLFSRGETPWSARNPLCHSHSNRVSLQKGRASRGDNFNALQYSIKAVLSDIVYFDSSSKPVQ